MPPDEITFADVVSVLPFNNVWWRLSWAASSFCRCWRRTAQSPAGYARAGEWNVARTGKPIRPDETYHVLVNDFMYAGGEDYGMLARFDPQAYNTAID